MNRIQKEKTSGFRLQTSRKKCLLSESCSLTPDPCLLYPVHPCSQFYARFHGDIEDECFNKECRLREQSEVKTVMIEYMLNSPRNTFLIQLSERNLL